MLALVQTDYVSIAGPDKVWAVDGPDDICTVLPDKRNVGRLAPALLSLIIQLHLALSD